MNDAAVSTMINFGPVAPAASSPSDGIITGRPMREGQLPLKPPSVPQQPLQQAAALKPVLQIPKVHKAPRPEAVISARSFSNPVSIAFRLV